MTKTMNQRAAIIGTFCLLVTLILTGFASTATRTLADTGSNWNAQYWNNTTLSGSPAVTRIDPAINFTWGSGSPDPSLTPGAFSAQWTLTNNFASGLYTFRAGAQGGIQVYIDSTLLIDKNVPVSTFTTYTAQANLAGGYHVLKVLYYAQGGSTGVLFSWTPPTGVPTSPPVSAATPTPLGTPVTIGVLGPPIGRIVYDVVNVRADPSISHAPLTQVYLGQVFPILGETANFDWCLVQMDDGSKAWIWRFAMFISGDTTQIPLVAGPTFAPPALVNVQATLKYTTFLHSRPSNYSGKKTGTIPKGTLVQVQALSTNHAWALVSGGGYSGWVYFPYLIFDNDNLNLLSEVPNHN